MPQNGIFQRSTIPISPHAPRNHRIRNKPTKAWHSGWNSLSQTAGSSCQHLARAVPSDPVTNQVIPWQFRDLGSCRLRRDQVRKRLKLQNISPGDEIQGKVHKETGICNEIGLGNASTTFPRDFRPKISRVGFSIGISCCFWRSFGSIPAASRVQLEGCSEASSPSPQPCRHQSSLT